MRPPILLALAFACAFPAAASAQASPDGNSGTSQYVEQLPSASGPTSAADSVGRGHRDPRSVSLGTRAALGQSPAGRRTLDVATSGTFKSAQQPVAPPHAGPAKHSGGSQGAGGGRSRVIKRSPAIGGGPSSGAAAGLTSAIVHGGEAGGFGFLLPLLLGLTAGFGIAFALRRRGAGGPSRGT
jgi:hypothetical protein